MDTRYLQTLVAVVDTGSFSKAARVLHLTQSAVSQRIKFLEEALDMDPFSKFALITFADAYLRCSMAEKSLDILERAISYYPDDDGFVMLKMVINGAINRVSSNACLN